jgi:hypothetical protein
MTIFRTQNEWKSAMMTLPDAAFFDLLRSVFGNIKTPFNKQNLLAELTAFLSRDDIRRNIADYIDEVDAQVITAVAILRNPSAGEAEHFFAGDTLDLQGILLNLEERFILYRFREGPISRLALNPVLEPVLKPLVMDMPLVFPSVPLSDGAEADGSNTALSSDDRILAALFAFVQEEGSRSAPACGLFKAEGRLRKKVLDSGKRVFPGLDLEAAIRGLLCLGVFRLAGEALVPDEHALRAFRDLEPRHRLIYWAAGIYTALVPAITVTAAAAAATPIAAGAIDPGASLFPLEAPQLLRGRLRQLAGSIDMLLGLMDAGRVYPPTTLRRVFALLEREEEGKVPAGIDIDALCVALVEAGLWRKTPQGYCLRMSPVPDGDESPAVVMDAPFFCLVYPGIAFADALTLASFTSVRETGAVFRFELNRESSLRGFERGMTAAAMGELLDRLSENRVESLLPWTLQDWEKRYGEVSLFEGPVLSLSPDRRYLAETKPLAALIRRELAPGLYLLAGSTGDKVTEALRKAGVDIFARFTGESMEQAPGPALSIAKGARDAVTGLSLFPPLGRGRHGYQDAAGSAIMDIVSEAIGLVLPAEFPPAASGVSAEAAEALKASFRSALTGRSLSRLEREELAARIERRLVLSESQLSSASIRYEKLEARGLDYVGKAAIAKQALNAHSLVEVVWSAADNDGGSGLTEQRVQGIPQGLEKSGGETILVMDDSRVPGNAPLTLRIPLGRISLLRRIKKSIFEG